MHHPSSLGPARPLPASMEPLPFRSGMKRRPCRMTAGYTASMEPLPFRSGMIMAQRVWKPGPPGSFNGAAPIQERNAMRPRLP